VDCLRVPSLAPSCLDNLRDLERPSFVLESTCCYFIDILLGLALFPALLTVNPSKHKGLLNVLNNNPINSASHPDFRKILTLGFSVGLGTARALNRSATARRSRVLRRKDIKAVLATYKGLWKSDNVTNLSKITEPFTSNPHPTSTT
jgi:hypothetical protein